MVVDSPLPQNEKDFVQVGLVGWLVVGVGWLVVGFGWLVIGFKVGCWLVFGWVVGWLVGWF